MGFPCYNSFCQSHADVAESADALASGASEGNFVGVQVPSSAPDLITVKASHFSDQIGNRPMLKLHISPVGMYDGITAEYKPSSFCRQQSRNSSKRRPSGECL